MSLQKQFVLATVAILTLSLATLAPAANYQPIVHELIQILEGKPELKEALKESIRKANRLEAPTLNAYYSFLDNMVTLIPTDRNVNAKMLEFYYLINLSPDDILLRDDLFQQWTHKFADDWGSFLNTPESARYLEQFYVNPIFNIHDYDKGTSGWLTFNQFFYRHVKPGKRPIAAPCDDTVIVSPADSVIQGQWEINENSEITAKGLQWSLHELLDGSPYQDRFKGGTYTHMFLNVNDYHRYHVPVRGEVLESRNIHGKVVSDVLLKSDYTLDDIIDPTFQFKQERGLVVLDSPVGLVAILPIGMAQVSSVNLTAEVGTKLFKGQEFGYFAFGGSDIVLLFEKGRVKITAKAGTHYKQGEAIAKSVLSGNE